MKELARRLKLIREEKGVTQTQVYKDIGIHNKTLSGYERGVSEPDLNTIQSLANYYNVSVDYLLGATNKRNDESSIENTTLKDIESLSEESKKELEQYIKLLKIKDEMDKSKKEQLSTLENEA